MLLDIVHCLLIQRFYQQFLYSVDVDLLNLLCNLGQCWVQEVIHIFIFAESSDHLVDYLNVVLDLLVPPLFRVAKSFFASAVNELLVYDVPKCNSPDILLTILETHSMKDVADEVEEVLMEADKHPQQVLDLAFTYLLVLSHVCCFDYSNTFKDQSLPYSLPCICFSVDLVYIEERSRFFGDLPPFFA